MIGKLQRRFVLIAMFVAIVVTNTIYGFIAFENYRILNKRADIILDLISGNNGEMPEYNDAHKIYDGIITRETKFQVRYFSVKLDSSDKVISSNMNNIIAISPDNVEKMILEIKENKSSRGYFGDYKYKINVDGAGNKMIVVLDCTQELNNLSQSNSKSIVIILTGLTIVFVLLSVISKRVLSPIIESIEKQNQFISNAGHELKTPIAVIMADAEVLEMVENNPESLELITSIKKQAERLNGLTATLLHLAKAEEGRLDSEITEFSITELIKDEINEFKYLAKEKEISFNDTTDISIIADRNSIKELIIIFLDNAIKYSDENGKIKIFVERQGKNVKVQFMNTCENPKSININKIFDRFYREDKSRNKKKDGYGIGLSMAKSIVDIHRGKISASITKDNYVCFTVIL